MGKDRLHRQRLLLRLAGEGKSCKRKGNKTEEQQGGSTSQDKLLQERSTANALQAAQKKE
jgi:hypothetical protein